MGHLSDCYLNTWGYRSSHKHSNLDCSFNIIHFALFASPTLCRGTCTADIHQQCEILLFSLLYPVLLLTYNTKSITPLAPLRRRSLCHEWPLLTGTGLLVPGSPRFSESRRQQSNSFDKLVGDHLLPCHHHCPGLRSLYPH